MPSILGTLLIGLILAAWAALAIRSLWKNRKSGCGCGCNGCDRCAKGHPQAVTETEDETPPQK